MELPKEKTFRALLMHSTEKYSDQPALSFVGQKALTYGDVLAKANGLTSLLISLGIQKGDRVALLGQNMPQWGVAYLAITSMGAVVVPILIDFTEAEIGRILAHSESRAIIVSEKQAHKLQGELPDCVKAAVLLDSLREISLGVLEMVGGVESVPEKGGEETGEAPVPAEEDLAAILYTSGTTGNPKGVMLSHRNILSNALNTMGIQQVDQNDRLLSVLPLPHTYECTIGFIIPFMCGAAVYYLDKLPTPAVLLPAMQEVKPTMMLTVPLIIEKVYQNRVLPKLTGSPLMRRLNRSRRVQRFFHRMAGKKIYKAFGGQLHFFGIGGAKLNAQAERFLRDAGFPYAIGYGLTETSPLLAGCAPSLTRYQSTGFSLPDQELKILDADPETGEGEILARGPHVMMGYYKDPEATQAVFTPDGWFKTGDLGSMDDDGYVYIKGRIKNVIVGATGENIYPEEIEAVINNQPHVLESLVYEWRGQLVAKVHLNYDEIDQRYLELKQAAGKNIQDLKTSAAQGMQDLKDSASDVYHQARDKVQQRLQEIQQAVNARLNKFSRLNSVLEQDEPFVKTPTKKIRRFLYQDKDTDKE